jgi:hypothetical protein
MVDICPRVFKGRHVDPHLAAESAERAARKISLIFKNQIMRISEFPLRPRHLTGHGGIEGNGIRIERKEMTEGEEQLIAEPSCNIFISTEQVPQWGHSRSLYSTTTGAETFPERWSK